MNKTKKPHCEYHNVCPYYAEDSFTCNDKKSNLGYCGKYNVFCDSNITPDKLIKIIRELIKDYLSKKYG